MSTRPAFSLDGENPQHFGVEASLTYIWDVATLSWIKNVGGGGGGGGAVTIADGADVTQGAKADVAWVSGSGSVIALLKTIASTGASSGLTDAQLRATPVPVSGTVTTAPPANASTNVAQMSGVAVSMNTGVRDAGTQRVTVATNDLVPVSGTFFQATQPVSAAALPLPAGAATSALQTQPGVDIGDVTVNNAAGASAVNVQDGGNSITVDGTVTTTPPANASTNVAQIAGTATDVNSGVKSAGTIRVVLATDQPALTNKLLVTPDSVALPANQSVNAAQLAGTTTDTNSGLKSAGTLRVVLATDQPALTNKLLVTPDSVALPANQSVNLAQVAGVNTVTGSGTATGAQRIELANNGTGVIATVTAVTAITNALPTGANIIGSVNGDVDHDAVNTLKQIQISGNATPVDVPPTLVSANGDRVRAWMDRAGANVVRRRKLRESFTVVYRLAEAAARLDPTFTFVANTNKQLATLHHTAAATKEVRLMKCQIGVLLLGTAAGQTIFEIREINTAPATGNPAITPKPHRFGGTAAECVALTLPTTAGTEVAANGPLGSEMVDYGVMAAATSVVNPMQKPGMLTLYDASQEDDEELPPTLPVATLSGWSITGRSTGAVVLRFWAIMRFTEEIP